MSTLVSKTSEQVGPARMDRFEVILATKGMGSGVIQQKSLDGDDIPGFHSLYSSFSFRCSGNDVANENGNQGQGKAIIA